MNYAPITSGGVLGPWTAVTSYPFATTGMQNGCVAGPAPTGSCISPSALPSEYGRPDLHGLLPITAFSRLRLRIHLLLATPGRTIIWSLGSATSGTFSVNWFMSDGGDGSGGCGGYSTTNFASTWSVSADGNSWTPLASHTLSSFGSGSYGSDASPITSQITGTYSYVKLDQYSSGPSEVCSDGETYVQSICIR